MKFYYFVIIVVHGQMILSEKPFCVRKGMKVCCSGYKWNEAIRICEECPPGYTGMDCKFMCYPPYYGTGCLQTCHCSNDSCDAVSGCKITSTTVLHEINEKRESSTGYKHTDNNEKDQINGPKNSSKGVDSQYTGRPSTSIVFYTTVTLIFVFVSFAMFYGVSHMRKLISSRREAKKSNINFTETTNSPYECVDTPQYF